MNPSADDKVPCNGPCRRRFQPATVNMDQTTANVLRSTARAPGLQWLCPECHLEFNLQQTARRCESDLPLEVWIMIFKDLDKRSMLRVRSTCRRWWNIVDTNKIWFKEITMDDQFQAVNPFPASGIDFSLVNIITVDDWWPPFGLKLTKLTLRCCEIALPVLLRMLRATPNLERLDLSQLKYTSVDEPEADFRLEKLEILDCERVFDVFVNIFTKLKRLQLNSKLNDGEEVIICHLLASNQGTLKNLSCYLTPFMIEQMAKMERLQLKNVHLFGEEDLAMLLSRTQTSIEDIGIAVATNEALRDICRNLTKLKSINVGMQQHRLTVMPSFLVEMSQLTWLSLNGSSSKNRITFECLGCATLTTLMLESFIADDSLRSFLSNSPNLETLEIRECHLDSWSDIFAARLESLRCLILFAISVDQCLFRLPKKLKNLVELEISAINISLKCIVKLLLRCPRLETLWFYMIDEIDDDFINLLGKFPQLKKLDITACPLTDKSVKLIVENYSHVRITIDCEEISDIAMKLLSYATRSQ